MLKTTLLSAAVTMFFAFPTLAAKTTPSEVDDEDSFQPVAIISKNCDATVPATGPGSAAEPITADLWELGGDKSYDCKWVRTEALLTWVDYWHYRANAHSDFEDLLFNNWDDYSFLIEDIAVPSISMRDLQRATVQLTAVYAELCNKELGDNVWIMVGLVITVRPGSFNMCALTKYYRRPFGGLPAKPTVKFSGSFGECRRTGRNCRVCGKRC